MPSVTKGFQDGVFGCEGGFKIDEGDENICPRGEGGTLKSELLGREVKSLRRTGHASLDSATVT